jgi:hypothetical protein
MFKTKTLKNFNLTKKTDEKLFKTAEKRPFF